MLTGWGVTGVPCPAAGGIMRQLWYVAIQRHTASFDDFGKAGASIQGRYVSRYTQSCKPSLHLWHVLEESHVCLVSSAIYACTGASMWSTSWAIPCRP